MEVLNCDFITTFKVYAPNLNFVKQEFVNT
jgi:hypothetical protein